MHVCISCSAFHASRGGGGGTTDDAAAGPSDELARQMPERHGVIREQVLIWAPEWARSRERRGSAIEPALAKHDPEPAAAISAFSAFSAPRASRAAGRRWICATAGAVSARRRRRSARAPRSVARRYARARRPPESSGGRGRRRRTCPRSPRGPGAASVRTPSWRPTRAGRSVVATAAVGPRRATPDAHGRGLST